jgi:hypothetical protein
LASELFCGVWNDKATLKMVTSGDVLHCTTKNVVSTDTSLQDYATAKILLSGNSDEDFITLRQWFE